MWIIISTQPKVLTVTTGTPALLPLCCAGHHPTHPLHPPTRPVPCVSSDVGVRPSYLAMQKAHLGTPHGARQEKGSREVTSAKGAHHRAGTEKKEWRRESGVLKYCTPVAGSKLTALICSPTTNLESSESHPPATASPRNEVAGWAQDRR